MRCLLINPPCPYSEAPIIPLGLAYTAAVLEEHGHDVEVLDLLVSKSSKDKITAKLSEHQPDVVGITCVTMNYPTASDILKTCKSTSQDIVTVIGGPHVTFRPVETLEEAPWIDIVVHGEGESTMLDIVSGRHLEEVQGLAYRSGSDGVVITPERPLIEQLDSLPAPAHHLFPLSRYHALGAPCSLITGRGCPFACIFCAGSRMGGRRVRYRNPELVVDEIERCLDLGFEEVNFENDLITLNHRHLHAICDTIIDRGLEFTWRAFARVDTVNPEVIGKMRAAGCTGVCYGVESGNQRILDTVKKKINLDQVRNAVSIAKQFGMQVQASFILGLPGETRETMEETLSFAQSLDTFYGVHVLAPFPGTEVREKADEYGIEILTDDWLKYDANRPVTRTEGASPEDIAAVLHRYYRGLRLTPEAIEGTSCAESELKHRTARRAPLAWTLVRGDVLESVGITAASDQPIDALAMTLAEAALYPTDHVRERVERWVRTGLLKYTTNNGNHVWSWA